VDADFLNVKMKTLQLHKTPVTIYPTTQQNIPDLHYKNLKYRIFQSSTSYHLFWLSPPPRFNNKICFYQSC